MKYFLAIALALASGSAFAQRLASRPYNSDATVELEGIYAGIGGGGQLMIFEGDTGFGYDVEARLGYSFGAQFQLYLCGALDSAKFNGGSFTAEQIAVCAQYHFVVKPAVMVYGRAGIGVSLSSDFLQGTGAGLMESGGIGVEIRMGPSLFLAPEVFYKNQSFSVG